MAIHGIVKQEPLAQSLELATATIRIGRQRPEQLFKPHAGDRRALASLGLTARSYPRLVLLAVTLRPSISIRTANFTQLSR